MRTFHLIILILGALESSWDPGVTNARHPQDGPDVDLRVKIEESKVEIQAIVNLVFCDEVIGQTRLFEESVEKNEVAPLREALLAKFQKEVAVKIDGIAVSPSQKDCQILPYEESDAEFFPQMGMRAVIKFRVTFSYSLKTSPRSVALHWGMYPQNLALAEFVDETILINAEWTAGTKTEIIPFREEEPEYIWHGSDKGLAPQFLAAPKIDRNKKVGSSYLWLLPIAAWVIVVLILFLRKSTIPVKPIAATLLIAAMGASSFLHRKTAIAENTPPPLSQKESIDVFNILHANIYRAFDYTEEEEIYDALSRSVSGQLLAEIYDQIYGSLIMQDQGGAVSRIQKVTPVQVEIKEPLGENGDSFTVETRWRVLGRVYHWGHTHMRTNEHLAEMTVKWANGDWRISSSQVLEQFRVGSQTSEGNR